MVTTYTVLKTLHVLAAAIWLGGSLMLTLVAINVKRLRDMQGYASFIGWLSFIAPRTFIPASLVLVGTGFWMVANGDLPYDTWVVLGIIGWLITFLAGNLLLSPQAKRADEALAAGGPNDPAAIAQADRLIWFARIDIVILALVVIDMVIKPGT